MRPDPGASRRARDRDAATSGRRIEAASDAYAVHRPVFRGRGRICGPTGEWRALGGRAHQTESRAYRVLRSEPWILHRGVRLLPNAKGRCCQPSGRITVKEITAYRSPAGGTT